MRPLFILALAALAALPAAAGETPWQAVAPGVRLRLISADVVRADERSLVGLEIDMPAGTRTYWRVPGQSGIVTELDTAGSSGISGHTIYWPYPVVDASLGYLDYAYFGPTVLPIELDIDGEAPLLQAAFTLGICTEVCIPAMAKFSLPLDFTKPDDAQQLRLNQAMALTPLDWAGDPEAIGAVSLDAGASGLLVPIADPGIDPASLIADMGASGQLFGTPQKSPDEAAILLPLLGGGDAKGLVGKPVRLTFMTALGPFETSRVIGQPSTAAAP
jgi:DsbC/DsbD-like thiol-disulfide interchange protein